VTVRKRIVVSGRVQGVFFRDSARQEAARLGIGGSARNMPDGTVEVIAEGDESAVDQLIEWCRSGPSYADVDDVSVGDEQPQGTKGFSTG
jgi:acylphosphatase